MFAALLALALVLGSAARAETAGSFTAPSYTLAGIVNSASNGSGALAPNTIASIYGTDLSYETRAIATSDLSAGVLPRVLGGVQVYVGGLQANLYFVSPHQINVLIPSILRPGSAQVYVAREGVAGPPVSIILLETAPGLFEMDPQTIVSTHADGSIVSKAAPATGGEVVVLYAVGLGHTLPDSPQGQIASVAAPLAHTDLSVLVNGDALDATRILYAGATPGFAGLYQVNIRLPAQIAPDPEIRLSLGGQTSKAGLKMPVRDGGQ